MGHVDTSTSVQLPSRRQRGGYWSLRYHRAADELCLHEPDGMVVAGLPNAADHIARMHEAVKSRSGPIGIVIPSAVAVEPWIVMIFPGSNEIALKTPLGDIVGGSNEAAAVVLRLVDATKA